MLLDRSSVRQYKTWILSGKSTNCGWVGPNFSSCHYCHQRHRAARTTMARNSGASTYTRKDVQLCCHVRLIELGGSERHPNPWMLKHACLPCWQQAQLCRQRVHRGWCSCAAAELSSVLHIPPTAVAGL